MTGFAERVADAVTALFVPGDREDRFEKAFGSGADIVILDLEDGVPPARRVGARAFVVRAVEGASAPVVVRINAATTVHHESDLAALRPVSGRLAAVMLAKAESREQIERIRQVLEGVPIIPLVESAVGVLAIDALSSADGVIRLALGAIDLSADLDCEPEADVLLPVRSRLVVASRAAGIASPLDSPSVEIRAEGVVRSASDHARRLGFGGALCIHPAQVPIVAAAFAPTSDQVAWATRVAEAGDGATQIDGRMVDRAVILRAQRILSRVQAGRS